MCPLLAQLKIDLFSFFAVAVYSTNEANKAGLKQSIFLDVYGWTKAPQHSVTKIVALITSKLITPRGATKLERWFEEPRHSA